MALPLLGPLRDLLAAHAGASAERVATTSAAVLTALVAVALLVAAGLVELTARTGFPIAALAFAALFGVLSVAVHVLGRVRKARRAARIAHARARAEADIAVATTLGRSSKPLLPLAAFLAAFVLARRQ